MTTSISRARLIIILGAVNALGPLAIDMYLPVFPVIAREFGAPVSSVQLTLSAFFIGIAAGQFFYGTLADRFGRRPALLFGVTLYVCASAGCALAPNLGTLITLRVLQAFGGCAGMVVSLAIVRDLFDPQDGARVMSRLWLVFGMAPIFAPSLGTWVVSFASWRILFWILVVAGSLSLLAFYLFIPETRPARAPPHPPMLRTVWRDCLALFRQRSFLGYAAAVSLAHGGVLAYVTACSFVFIDVYGVTPAVFALLFAFNSTALVLSAQWNVRLLRHRGSAALVAHAIKWPPVLGAVLIVLTATRAGGVLAVVAIIAAILAATSIIRPNGIACALAGNGERAGTAVSLIGSLQFLLGTLAGTFMSLIHDGTGRPMAITMTLLATSGFVLYHWLVKEKPS